ncbi:MAG TPA: isoprenylcysteine carboxylmethyltransferase family protein [Terracidiphilus sp.]|nr:isoprenylcysteine carboxylmethyltransferase family protein [Terracidiphilus sp.]
MPARRRNVLISVSFVVFGGPGFLLVYIPYWLTRFRIPPDEPLWQICLAAMLVLVGLVPLFESIIRFIRIGRGTLVPTAPTEHLVVSGLYRHVRNPMYLGVGTSLAGESILFASRNMVTLLVGAWLCMHLFVRFYEEPTLTRRHPEEYPAYKRHVPRWLPRFTPWKPAVE